MTDTIFPKGFNCYTPLSVEIQDTGFIYRIKPCSFFVGINNIEGRCSALDIEITDQVKLCGINEYSDEEIAEMMESTLEELNEV